MSLYFLVMIGTLIGPFALSWDKKIHFYTFFKPLFLSISLVSAAFLFWDEYFTLEGIWGFTPAYLQGIYLGHLPLEEILFFLFVPYACVFIYEVIKGYFPQLKLEKLARYFGLTITIFGFLLGFLFMENWYTRSACLLAGLLTVLLYFRYRVAWYGSFVVSYLVALVPFVIVNGILTGMTTPEPIVWYSEAHIMGPRLITIPIEDLFYNYDLLILVVFLYERFKKS